MANPPHPTDAGEPGKAPKTRSYVTFANSVPWVVGVWVCAAFPLVLPIWFAVQELLDGLGWVEDVGVANMILSVLVLLIATSTWALLAIFVVKVTRDWAARRRHSKG